ncbi:MAG TPA: lipopolysaccharide kinase InaA family protein [Planctomycetota bacterium]|nr:lipopolysaccharide kinase InaA family protein [Planctomycetota bacterium]
MPKYAAMSAGGWKWRVANGWHASFRSGAFTDFGGLLKSARPVKDLNIKRTVEIRADGRDFLVKIYKRRGALHRLKAAVLGSRADRELAALVAALERGVPTLPFVAIGERGGESCVVIAKEHDRLRLDHLLAESPRRRSLIEEYGRWARRVHDAGLDQSDFNPTNVLAKRGAHADLRLIDFEKVRVGRPMAEEARLRALAKIDRMIAASRADRLRFFKSYVGAASRDRADLARLTARMAELVRAQRAKDALRRREACVREGRNFAKFRHGDAWGWYRRDLVDAASLPALVSGGGPWRRVPEARALDAWRAANGTPEGERPAAVVIESRSARGELAYLK